MKLFPISPHKAGIHSCGAWLGWGLVPAVCCLILVQALVVSAQPDVSDFRAVVNDIPNEPLVTVILTGASNVSCLTIEEDLPGAAIPLNISGDGVWVPSLGVIRWGPYFNTAATNVSYRLTGPAGSYAVNGGSWMDGEWYFSPGLTMVTVLPTSSVPYPLPQVATPVFMPASGSNVPVNVGISCSTAGATIYYTLDGSLPTTNSHPYTNAIFLASASTLRAVAFTNGWTPSAAAVAFYGPPAATANAQVTQSVSGNSTTAPTVTFDVTPGTNASCVAVTETLPLGLSAVNISAEGNYIASNNMVVWGPFFGTNAQTLSYQAVGPPGNYSVQAVASVDGVASQEFTTNVIVGSSSTNGVPTPPSQVAAPVFYPASGHTVPVNVVLADSTPNAAIYYTLDGSLPTQNSIQYLSPIHLTSAATIRAAGFLNGWTPSVAAVAFYGPPAAPANANLTASVDTNSPGSPVVEFSITPGPDATCEAVTASLPLGVSAVNISDGGSYTAEQNLVFWGPFFGAGTQSLSFAVEGPTGTYPVQVTWSVDGVSSAMETNVEVASASLVVPTPPPQEPTPEFTPPYGTDLPIRVTIASSDGFAQIHYTTDGSLPTENSPLYTDWMFFRVPTTLRAVAFRPGYLPSAAALGFYVAALPTNNLSLARTVAGNASVLPSVTVEATPVGSVSCYAETEYVSPGLTPVGLPSDAYWNPADNTINWGPFLDELPRSLTYHLLGPGGLFPLAGQGSFDGYSAAVTGATFVSFNPAFIGQPVTNAGCVTEAISYTVDIDPAPGTIVVDTASGTVDWGDGTQTNFTQPDITLQKTYASTGTYTVTVTANWTGHTSTMNTSGNGTKTDTIEVFSTCGGPVITSEPVSLVTLAGATVQFSVGVSSDFPLTYQWYYNQTNPVFSPSMVPTLTLPNVSTNAAGSYSVVVSNAYGSTNSTVATLAVVAPLITGVTLNVNGSVTLSFEGLTNVTTRIWATTNLSDAAAWQPIYTNTVTTGEGTWQFTDTNTVGSSARFYRFSTP